MPPSSFIWYELLTADADAAARFYAALLRWTSADSGQPGMDYRYLSTQGVPIGGLMTLPQGASDAGMRPSWLGYVSVPNVDSSVASFVAAGGAVLMPAVDLPGIGRIAMVADPQGAALYVMAPIGAGPATSFAPGKAGHGGWHELHARDAQAALAFYANQFGWRKVAELDMGPMGAYLQFDCGSGAMAGGIIKDPSAARPYWLYCFNVEDIDAARTRLLANGGTVLMDRHQVPTGEWIIRASDPQGAVFVLIGPKHAGR